MVLRLLIVASAGMLTASALADDPAFDRRSSLRSPGTLLNPLLVPVDQRVEDVSPMGLSLRRMDIGLGAPAQFSQVYRVRGADNRFVRVEGGLYAVFPQSAYINTRMGELPLVPANTVFSIGGLPSSVIGDPFGKPLDPAHAALLRARVRTDTARDVADGHRDEGEAAETHPATDMTVRFRSGSRIITRPAGEISSSVAVSPAFSSVEGSNEFFRERMRHLLERAAAAERSETRRDEGR